jgi:hypothetical protein
MGWSGWEEFGNLTANENKQNQGKCQFSLFKLVDGGERILANSWSCLASFAVSMPERSAR